MTGGLGGRRAGQRLRHSALFYDDEHAYVTAVSAFVRAGSGEGPVLVAVPTPRLELLRDHLWDVAGVRFSDMTELGANPSRIIPTVRGFVDDHADQAIRFVGEPIWAGRDAAEIAEATRHEALINLAFAGTGTRILCPYDTSRLGRDVLADAERTHPDLVIGRRRCTSPHYTDPVAFADAQRWPLPPRPADAQRLDFDDLTLPRDLVRRRAAAGGLPEERMAALVLAVNEVCTNTLIHGPGRGTLHVWQTRGRLTCEVHDAGTISDPLAGRRRPPALEEAGRGLFIAHHLCDLVEVRSTTGTTIRLHMTR